MRKPLFVVPNCVFFSWVISIDVRMSHFIDNCLLKLGVVQQRKLKPGHIASIHI